MAEQLAKHVVLGMAGHIDHGKTAIVRALTGTNTDRLKEEIARGMTTDLGFAFLGESITVIDVPGHEKFVKTMVAGVNTIDMALLVIAADDGIMPQTREHLAILNFLQATKGVIAVNKIDLVEPEWVELVIDDIKRLVKGTVLESAPIIPVCTLTNVGIDKLREEIVRIANTIKARHDKGIFRLPVDRVFTIKGFGTVVAGTVLSGKIAAGDAVELQPQGTLLRVRGVQVHDESVNQGDIGFRTAINLGRIEKTSIERGDVLVEPGFYKPTYMIDVQFSLLKSWDKDLENRTRLRVHIGTSEIIARIILLDKEKYAPGDDGYAQLHFEKPVVADIMDRFVVRSYSPPYTMGGGTILDVHPKRHKQFEKEVVEKLERIFIGDPNQIIMEHFNKTRFVPKTDEEIAKALGISREDLSYRLKDLEVENRILRVAKNRIMSRDNYESLGKKMINCLETFHEQNPLLLSLSAGKLRLLVKQEVDQSIFDEMLAKLQKENVVNVEGDQVSLAGRQITLNPKLEEHRKRIEKQFIDNLFDPPGFENIISDMGEKVRKVLTFMVDSGDLVRVEKDVYFHKNALEEGMKKITALLSGAKKEATMADMRSVFESSSRKKLVALLEYFDRTGFTKREGDARKLKGL